MLAARDIHKSFGREMVLRGASLAIEAGELVGLIGASGAGKTVLARCLIGLETWESGQLVVDDRTIDSPYPVDDPRWLAVRHKVGLVAQNRALPPYRTAYAQIAEGPKFVKRMSHNEVELKMSQWTERFGLSLHLHKYPHELADPAKFEAESATSETHKWGAPDGP
jgi:ABC-type polar amino acid transport system ATPase subunit